MSDATKIKCLACSATMNHHAVKLEYGTDEPINTVFEGVLKNVNTCPDCGAVEMTPAE